MTAGARPPSIAASAFDRWVKSAGGDVLRVLGLCLLLGIAGTDADAAIPQHGDTIANTAAVNSSLGNASSNTVNVRVLGHTTSSIGLLTYSAAGGGNNFVASTQCSTGGQSFVAYTTLAPPQVLGGATLTVPGALPLAAPQTLKSGNPLFIQVNDPDQNIDPALVESVQVTVTTAAGDSEYLRLQETTADSGLFTGYIQTMHASPVVSDCKVNSQANDRVTISYIDARDGSDIAVSSVLVDPYGLVLRSDTGAAIDGVTLTLLDAASGQPATVYGDDGISLYPASVVSGGSVTDQAGTQYDFPPGNYRFPLVAPGTYRLQVTTPGGYSFPSTVNDAVLQTLPGAPFALSVASRGADFSVPAGPPVQVDVPLDPAPTTLFLSKSANRDSVTTNEFVVYELQLANSGLGTAVATAIDDLLPPGFRYQKNSARLNGAPVADPTQTGDGRNLRFTTADLAAGASLTLRYVAQVSALAATGKAINRATASAADGAVSNTARASVRVLADGFNDRSRILGQVLLGSCVATRAEGDVAVRLESAAAGNEVMVTATVVGEGVALKDLALLLNIPQVMNYVRGSLRLNGQAQTDPPADARELRVPLGERSGAWRDSLSFSVKAAPQNQNDLSLLSNNEFKVLAWAEFTSAGSGRLRTPVAENAFRGLPGLVWPKFSALTAELRLGDKQILDDLARNFAGQTVKSITVTGHTDDQAISPAGQKLYADNYELSVARAQSVADYLRKIFNLQPAQITVVGAGPDEPIAANTDAESRQLNRRVEISIETDTDQSRSAFRIIHGDSGPRSVHALGALQSAPAAELGEDTRGVPGITLLLEDGRYAVSDERGMYHFEGLQAGSHVVQIDPASVPSDLEIFSCENNTRIAGDPASRFVDSQGGSLWRSDFYLRPKATANGSIGLRMYSEVKDGIVAYRVLLHGDTLRYRNLRLRLTLPRGFVYLDGSLRAGVDSLAPVMEGNSLIIHLGDRAASTWDDSVTLSAIVAESHAGDRISRASLVFDTPSRTDQESPEVDNVLSEDTADNRRFEFLGDYAADSGALSPEDMVRLDAIVATLRSTAIKHLRVAPVASSRRTLPLDQAAGSHSALAANYLARKLALFNNQVFVAESPGSASGDDDGLERLEILVTVVDSEARRQLRVTRGDSGYWKRSLPAGAADRVGNPGAPVSAPADTAQGILDLADTSVSVDPYINLRVRLPSDLKPRVLVDDREIPPGHLALTQVDAASNQTLYAFLGVPLGEPGSHRLTVRGEDTTGNMRFEQTKNLVRAGEIRRLVVQDTSGNLADGKRPVSARLQLLDARGNVVPAPLALHLNGGNLRPLPPDDLWRAPAAERDAVQLQADGSIAFAPVSSSGLYTADLSYNDISLHLEIPVQPHFRDWVMVGLAEGSAGYNAVHGNMQALRDSDVSDEYYQDGRLAFYAKGQVQGKWLLTLAYDSGKSRDKVDEGLYQIIDPNKYYTLYGDAGPAGNDAPSRERLYLRLEAQAYYLLFGDFDTDLTVSELSRYSRSYTGVKSAYNDQHFNVTAFAARADQAFVRDDIAGDGTSGLYRLSRHPVVQNSEKIRLETRDRFHSQTVLASQPLARHLDYDIDAEAGTLYFKQAVYAHDENFNPQYIVAEYEVANADTGHVNGGLRAAAKAFGDKLEIGATGIHEDAPGAGGSLRGVDLNLRPDAQTELRAEWAASDSDAGGQTRAGDAWLTQVKREGENYRAKIYAREQEGSFGLGQQQATEADTRKVGADLDYKLSSRSLLQGAVWREDYVSLDSSREVYRINNINTVEPYSWSAGARVARDQDAAGAVRESDLLTAGIGRRFLAQRLQLRADGELAVGDDDNPQYPSRLRLGGDYLLAPGTSVFLEQEYTDGADSAGQLTRLGVKATPWRNASVRSGMESHDNENGERTFATLGLTQNINLGKDWLLDIGLDRSRNLRSAQAAGMNNTVDSEDYTALSLGGTYKQPLWSATGRLEGRDGRSEDKTGVIFGLYRQQTSGLGLAATLKYFASERDAAGHTRNGAARFSLAYRPDNGPWIILDQLNLSRDDSRGTVSRQLNAKAINNINLNYLFNHHNQLALNYGLRFNRDTIDGEPYAAVSHLLGTEYRFDITPLWDLGMQAASTVAAGGAMIKNSCGLSAGLNMARNIWLSAGYNFLGFRDRDFNAAAYTAAGPFLKFRMSLSQQSARDALAWWEHRGTAPQ